VCTPLGRRRRQETACGPSAPAPFCALPIRSLPRARSSTLNPLTPPSIHPPSGTSTLLAALAASPLPAAAEVSEANKVRKVIKKEYLNAFQKSAIRAEIQKRADTALAAVLDAGDAPFAVRLLLADAAGYDPATKTGGVDGSVVLFEASSPAVKPCAAYISKLKTAKATIDAAARPGQAPISWADLEVLGARVALSKSFKAAKLAAGGNEQSVAASKSDFPVLIGRVDATAPPTNGGAANLPAPGADPAAIASFFGRIGAKPDGTFARGGRALLWQRPAFLLWGASFPAEDAAGEEARLAGGDPEFAAAKTAADRSRSTASRTDYEIDLADALLRLASSKAGAAFDPDAFLYDITVESVKIA
jgi:L-ascorbate peroxidase